MTAAQACLLVACSGLGELGAAAFFLRKHFIEKRAAGVNSPTTVEHVVGHSGVAASRSLLLGAVFCVSALISFGIAAFMWFVIAPKGVVRDQTAQAFVDAARSSDSVRLKSLSAPGAKVDEAFFAAEVAGAPRVHSTNYDLALGGQSCVEYEAGSRNVRFWLYLEEQEGRWLVLRAGPKDPECETQLHSD